MFVLKYASMCSTVKVLTCKDLGSTIMTTRDFAVEHHLLPKTVIGVSLSES
jgi:hypothetical protein